MKLGGAFRSLPEGGGAFLVDKPEGISSFGVVNRLKGALRRNLGVTRGRDLPKIGHGGTLDPFATGLLVVLVGHGVKLARYFLDSQKSYEFTMRFGETNAAGDLTEEVTGRTQHLPSSLEEIRGAAAAMAAVPYLQVPPMYSAKKKDGKRLYELARKGVQVEREAVECTLHELEILSYERPRARGRVRCSSGTYVRTLAQDLAAGMGSLALLDELRRTASGAFSLGRAMPLEQLAAELEKGTDASEVGCWLPLAQLLDGMPSVEASLPEARSLVHGQQAELVNLGRRAIPPAHASRNPQFAGHLAIFHGKRLIAVARHDRGGWELERVFGDSLLSAT